MAFDPAFTAFWRYRCRRCSAFYPVDPAVDIRQAPDVLRRVLAGEQHEPPLLAVHHCPDGNVGVGGLVGCAEEKER